MRLYWIKRGYKGTNSLKLTNEEKEEVEKLGLIDFDKKSIVSQTIEVLTILKENGVDINKIKQKKTINGNSTTTILNDLIQEGLVSDTIINNNELDENFPIGQRISQLKSAYKGHNRLTISEVEKKEVEKLGIIEVEVKSIVSQTLEIAKMLKDNGVKFEKLQLMKNNRYFLLKEIQQEGIDIKRIIEENDLDENYPIGQRISAIRLAYKKTGKTPISLSEKKEVERLGIMTLNPISETLRIVQILKKEGIDLKNIKLQKTIDGKAHKILLREIEDKHIDIEKIIEENQLDPDYPIGTRINAIRLAYNGTSKTKLSKEERGLAEQTGIVKQSKKTSVAETIEILEKLQLSGINVNRIQKTKRINGNSIGILLKDIKQEGINIDEVIEKNAFDKNFPIGDKMSRVMLAYNGKIQSPITDDEKKRLEDLGMVEEKQNVISEALNIAKILKINGINLEKIKLSTITGNKKHYTTLKELNQYGIDIEKIIREEGLDEEYSIGLAISKIRGAYNGKNKYTITNTEKREAEELGLIKKNKRTGKEIAEASISSLTNIEMADKEDKALREVVEKTKEGGINLDEQS